MANEEMTTFTDSRPDPRTVNVIDAACVSDINYKEFFNYDKNPSKIKTKEFDSLKITIDGDTTICEMDLLNDPNFIRTINVYADKFLSSTPVRGIYILNYLNPCIENTYDKISHVQVNHYEANVFIDGIVTAINRYIIKDKSVETYIYKLINYMFEKVFKKLVLNISYTENRLNSDLPIVLDGFTVNKLFDMDYFDSVIKRLDSRNIDIVRSNPFTDHDFTRKTIEIIEIAFVHYLFRETCDYINSEVNVYANMIISDVAQYYNSVSNVFYETLNKLSKKVSEHIKLDSNHLPIFDGISEEPFNSLDKEDISDEKLMNSIDNYISTKYSEMYVIISLLQSVERKSQNPLANVDSPAHQLEANILQPMMLENLNLYKKLYYSLYEKYILNGFEDKSLFNDLASLVKDFITMRSKLYKGSLLRHSIYSSHPSQDLVKEFEAGMCTTVLPISRDKLNELIKSHFFNVRGKNYYEKTYGSRFDELKSDIAETLESILVNIDNIIRYQLMFEGRVNEWACYLVDKAEKHITFDVVQDFKQSLSEEFSPMNHLIIMDMMEAKGL